jgi:SAM-dependent methyltransferase
MAKTEIPKTIIDFGNQWGIHGELRENKWTSDQMFRDHFPNDFDFSLFEGARVLEVGSGSGRILHMLSNYRPRELIGVEPSKGFSNLKANTSGIPNLKLLNTSGSDFKATNLDVVVSFGVIHHIPEAKEVTAHIYESLTNGGYFLMWVYGRENNQPYVLFQAVARKFTKLIPDNALDVISLVISYAFDLYGVISKSIFRNRLPPSLYYKNVYSGCGRREKKYIIFDQLNPDYSKYYSENEVFTLLRSSGFEEIKTFHRHGYSWTAIARKTSKYFQ